MAEAGVNEVPQGGGGYPPPAHSVAGTYYDVNWNEVNADGSPKTATRTANLQAKTLPDGTYVNFDPVTGKYFLPGTTVEVDPADHSKKPSSGSSGGGGGGGGAASQAGRYSTHVDTTGAITGIPGATYQEDSFDGSITVVNRPSASTGSFSNPLDKNNDGLNDSTGWANGVFKDASSPSGFYYASGGQYIPVTPDGAPYTGPDLSGGGGANAKTWTGQGPKGYGTYYLDGANGTPGTFIGDTRAPSAAASSGTPRPSTSSGSSSSGSASAQINAAASAASDAARAAQQAAHDAWQGNQNDAQRNWQAAQNAIDRALKLASDRADFELKRTGLVQDQTKMLLDGAKQFADLVSSTDPIKYRAFLEANGGNVWAGLANGGTAVSDNANLGAARTLRALENPTHIPTWDEIMAGGGLDVTNPPTVGVNGTPIGYGNDTQNNGIGNTGTPVGGAMGSTTGGTTTGAGGVGNAPTINLTSDPIPQYGQRVLGSSPSGGWEIDPTTGLPARDLNGQMIWNPNLGESMPTISGGAAGFGNFDLGQQIGQPMTVGQRNSIADAAYGNWNTDAYNSPGHTLSIVGDRSFSPGSYGPNVRTDQVNAILGTYSGATPYGNDQVNHVIPTQAVLPNVSKFASGGVMVGGGMAVTGDSHTGRPNEEMVINLNPDPRDRIAVVPMDRIRQMGMGPAVRSIINRGAMQVGGAGGMQMPRAADGGVFGADSYLNPVTPEDQPYLDRVQAIRDATDFSAWNPFRSDYFQRDPTIRSADELSVQAARGIPQASLVSYAQRYALPGIGRGALRIGV